MRFFVRNLAAVGIDVDEDHGRYRGQKAQTQVGLGEGADDVLSLCERAVAGKAAEDGGGDGDAHAHGQLHDDGQQAVAAAGLPVGKIDEGDGVHGGELHGVDDAEHAEDEEHEPVIRIASDDGKQGDHRAQRQGVDREDRAVSEASDQRGGDAFGDECAHGHGNHGQPGMHGRVSQSDLQQKRRQKRHGAVAQPREQVAEDADGEVAHGKKFGGKQRSCRDAGVKDVPRQRGQPEDDEQYHRQICQMQFADAFQSEGDGEHEGGEKHETGFVERIKFTSPREIRHVFERRDDTEKAHRDVDEEYPVP